MRITLVGALAIAGVALLVFVLLNLNRGDSGKLGAPPLGAPPLDPPEDRPPSTLLELSARSRPHPGA